MYRFLVLQESNWFSFAIVATVTRSRCHLGSRNGEINSRIHKGLTLWSAMHWVFKTKRYTILLLFLLLWLWFFTPRLAPPRLTFHFHGVFAVIEHWKCVVIVSSDGVECTLELCLCVCVRTAFRNKNDRIKHRPRLNNAQTHKTPLHEHRTHSSVSNWPMLSVHESAHNHIP